MIILTDLDLVLIRNPDEWWWNRRAPYGSIVHYVPLKRITRLSLAEGEDGLLDLCVHLPGEEEIRRQFQTSQRADVERLVSQFETLTPADGELAAAPA
jgi:hypothetical protein